MKAFAKLLILLMLPILAAAQNTPLEKLKDSLKMAGTDSARRELLHELVHYYAESNRETCVKYIEQSIELDKKNGKMVNLASDLDNKAYQFTHQQKFAEAFRCTQEAKKLAEDPANENNYWHSRNNPHTTNFRLAVLASIHHDLGHLMGATGNTAQQIAEYRQTIAISKKAGVPILIGLANMNLGYVYDRLGKLDSALVLSKIAVAIFERTGFQTYLGTVYNSMASIYSKKGDRALVLLYCHKAEITAIAQNNLATLGTVYHQLSGYYLQCNSADSCVLYAKKSLAIMRSTGFRDIGMGYETLYKSYQLYHKPDSVTKYLQLAFAAKDSSYNVKVKNLAEFQKQAFQTQIQLDNLEKEKEAARSRNRTYVLLSAIASLGILALIFYRNNRQKQKANHLLTEQKEEIETQRDQLGSTIHQLKATQTQLVQAEKMASLGELTAGIAHEIQNPLNFVNNFSEVNKEMLLELELEIKNGNTEDALIITGDLIQNEEKINHHGKRADGIVKGMLEHSRSHSGKKEATDLNVMTDEFMRLAYHGLRAKYKLFNAELLTHFDPKLPKINVSQQDIGRVMLNLFNNAFYAVNQKLKTGGADYKPEVSLTTSSEKGNIIIKVKDNGNGIPDAIKEKIMQPFFTTKPTGEGTGLGLSLSYDIVVNGHGGSISVDTREGDFTEFIVTLPSK